jgi:hypothetical protein
MSKKFLNRVIIAKARDVDRAHSEYVPALRMAANFNFCRPYSRSASA